MKQLPLALLLLLATVTFAQRTTVKLAQPGKDHGISYENPQVIIFFEQAAFTAVFSKINRKALPPEDHEAAEELFQKPVGEVHLNEAVSFMSPAHIRLLIKIINDGIGATLLSKGNAAVYDKKNGRIVKKIRYETTGTSEFSFYFTGSDIAFFNGSGRLMQPVNRSGEQAETTSETVEISTEVTTPDDTQAETRVDENKIYTLEEARPQYPGGMKELAKYMTTNLRNPAGCNGTVFVSLIVNKDGSLTEHTLVKGIGTNCDAEAIRLMRVCPAWIPAEYKGKKVKVRLVIPVKFKTS